MIKLESLGRSSTRFPFFGVVADTLDTYCAHTFHYQGYRYNRALISRLRYLQRCMGYGCAQVLLNAVRKEKGRSNND